MLPFAALLLALQAAPAQADTVRADAYRDATARALVQGARARRETADRSVAGYTARVQERTWAGLRTLGRDRTLFSMQTAARVEWRRDGPSRVTVTGSRMMGPDGEVEVAGPKDRYPANFAYTPGDDPLVIRLSDSTWVRHPLAPGSERFYRFRTGRSSSVTLPGGRTVRTLELEVEPRRRDPRLIRGSVWLDADTHGVVRILFSPAAPLAASLGVAIGSDKGRRTIGVNGRAGSGGRGGWLGAGGEAEVRYVTVEYGLHEGRWWLLRSLALEGVARGRALGLSAAVPVRWERSYSDYSVDGATEGAPAAITLADTASTERAGAACPKSRTDGACRCVAGSCRIVQVEVPADTAALLASAELPPSFAEAGAQTLSGTEVDELASELRRSIPPVWALQDPQLRLLPPGLGTLRYNRVEGLSVGVGAEADFGAFAADLLLRMGTADREPNAELGVTRETGTAAYRVAGYRRLAAVDGAARPFGAGNSLGALLWGRDHGDYFRAAGVEVLGGPAATEQPWYGWRVFAEHQSGAERNTDFSLRDAIGGGDSFRPNIQADRADQVGASLVLRGARKTRIAGPRAGAELFVEGSAGSFDFARPRLLLSGGAPLPGRLFGSVEAAAGTAFGAVPTQGLWYLGGPATLRGYDGNAARGEAFWRARGELATRGPLTRIGVFADAGWAGSRERFGDGDPLVAVGVGASLLDGWLRFDVARALVAPTGWSAYLSVEPPF